MPTAISSYLSVKYHVSTVTDLNSMILTILSDSYLAKKRITITALKKNDGNRTPVKNP